MTRAVFCRSVLYVFVFVCLFVCSSIGHCSKGFLVNLRVSRVTGPSTAVNVANFVFWLYEAQLPEADVMYWQFVRWLAFLVERTRWSEEINTDPFTAPAVSGESKKKSCRIAEALKDCVAEAAAEGKIGRSAHQVVEAAKRFRGLSQLASYGGWVEKWREVWQSKCWEAGKVVFRAEDERVLSLAMDGCRLSGLDVLVSTAYSPAAGVGLWLPPMVG